MAVVAAAREAALHGEAAGGAVGAGERVGAQERLDDGACGGLGERFAGVCHVGLGMTGHRSEIYVDGGASQV